LGQVTLILKVVQYDKYFTQVLQKCLCAYITCLIYFNNKNDIVTLAVVASLHY